jgi:hypothetical protein
MAGKFSLVTGVWVMVFNTTFNNISIISWRPVLLVEETGVNHRPAASLVTGHQEACCSVNTE